MSSLALNNYDNSYQEEYIEFAQWQFYNYVNGESFLDDDGVRWNVGVVDTDDVKIATLVTATDTHFVTYSESKLHSLNIWGLKNVGNSDIVPGGYSGNKYGKGTNNPDLPWMQLISLNAQGTHIVFKSPGGLTHDDIIARFGNGRPTIACPLATIRPGGEVWYGWIAFGFTGAGNRYSTISICYCRFLTNTLWGDLSTEPGDTGYKPTGNHYSSDRPGVGGKGHNQHPTKHTPEYKTGTISNPGAPNESVASVIGAGLIHPYKIDTSNLGALTSCLYGTTLGGLITNLAIDPLDFIISLNIFPCSPTVGSSTHVCLGKWICTDSGVDSLGGNVVAYPLSKQFKTISFGSLNVRENWGSFLDYTNSKVEIYLPFIGFVDLETSEIMDGSIALDYTIDFLTGMCVANICCTKSVETPDGVVYSQYSQHAYQGNCAISVPLSQMQYGQMIGSIINAGVQGLRGGMLNAGISLAGDFISGNMSPQASTKGSITANAGFCSVLYPYLRITRPISAEPDSFQDAMGYPSYINSTLGECDDLCICESIDLHSISGATDSEIERIRQMCLEGVHV